MERSSDLKWTRRALGQIERIEERIAPHDPVAARELAGLILSAAQMLRRFPYAGREVVLGIRELVIHRHYLVTYRAKR